MWMRSPKEIAEWFVAARVTKSGDCDPRSVIAWRIGGGVVVHFANITPVTLQVEAHHPKSDERS
jgi:hypothetical protein